MVDLAGAVGGEDGECLNRAVVAICDHLGFRFLAELEREVLALSGRPGICDPGESIT